MEKSTKVKFIFCMVLAALGFYLLTPTYWSLHNPEKVDQIPGWMPKTAMKLGLDLQGGVHMVLGVDLDKVVLNQLASYGRGLEKAVEKAGAKINTKVLEKSFELEAHVANEADKQKVSDIITKEYNVLEFVGESGNDMVLRMVKSQESNIRDRAIDQSIETIRNRIDEFGVAEPVLSRKGDNQILVEFPGAKDTERLKSLIGQTAQLTFQIVPDCKDQGCIGKMHADLDAKIKAAETKGNYNRDTYKKLSDYRNKVNEDLKAQLPPDTVVAFQKERDVNVNGSTQLIPYLLSTKNMLSGEYIEDAYVSMHKENNFSQERPVVAFKMNSAGAGPLAQLTTEFRHYSMAIVLDGVVRSAPNINGPLPDGSGIIMLGAGSIEDLNKEARDLAIVLRAGALPASIDVQEERVIGASMGKDAIDAGRRALEVAAVLIFIFMGVYYGLAGMLGNVVILMNIVWIFALLGMIGATLTLPGIAGIVLTVGIAADAVIIIFERMREEMRLARNSRQIVELGFDHAFATILDSNVTTAIGAFVLLQYGTGSIRGFALTLLVGIAVNVFMATVFMKILFNYFINNNQKKLRIGIDQHELQQA